MIIESTRAGPAFCEAAVPVSTKMPVPMIEPMPSAVRFQGPSDRRSAPPSASALSSVSDFVEKRPMPQRAAPRAGCLARDERPGIGLARVQRETVFGGREAGVPLEEAREVALIAEAGRDGDVAERRARGRQLAPRELDAHVADVA